VYGMKVQALDWSLELTTSDAQVILQFVFCGLIEETPMRMVD